jgi:arabinogalactan oligomer/maltooligosaccharide transport system permease protein
VFVVIFPILFGFAIAFTNYNLYHTPPAKLVDWVGLKTFVNIFTLSIWRSTFLDVLQWTVVWTLLATTLQCTVGVLLAILVNQKDLRFKPLIRTIFILPWAVPGFVTILVFAGMFNDSFGVINNAILSFFGIAEGVADRSVLDENGDHDANLAWFPVCLCHDHRRVQAIPTICMKRRRWTAPAPPLRTITLPLVLYSIAPIIITQYTFNFNNFNIIYLFNNGGLRWRANAGGRIFWCRGSTS